MTGYEIASSMLKFQHQRWNQWAIFFLGSVATVFVV